MLTSVSLGSAEDTGDKCPAAICAGDGKGIAFGSCDIGSVPERGTTCCTT